MLFEKYRAAGLCVVPLKNGVPAVKWGQYQDALPSAEIVAAWEKYDEYALLCGKVSGVIALDIDTNDEQIISDIYTFLTPSPVNKLGSKGFTAFYRYNGEKTKQWGGLVEILSDKHLTTIPPSKHRTTGKPYEWTEGNELIGADLPYLTSDFYSFMDDKFPAPERIIKSYDHIGGGYSRGETTLDEAVDLLSHLSPDMRREPWVNVGMSLRDEFGDTGFDVFNDWSKGGKTYNVRDTLSAWRSFNKQGITIATLYDQARLHGWHPAPIIRPEADTSVADAFAAKLTDKSQVIHAEEKLVQKPVIASLPVSEPVQVTALKVKEIDPMKLDGLIGDTVRWICSDAMFPQPMLALLHILSWSGAVFGRRYASPMNTRTNLYLVGVANTAAGKNHSRVKLPILAREAKLAEFGGAHGVISDTGVARSLYDRPSQMLMLDEWGLVLQSIGDKKAPSHNKKIKTLLMALYSQSGSNYSHGDYANKKLNESITIENPNLCVYGTTTEKEYVKALNKDAVESGELNRVMAIKVDAVLRRKTDFVATPPQDLIDRWERFSLGDYSLSVATNGSIPVEPKIVGWGECDDLQWKLAIEQDKRMESGEPSAALWGRRHENIIKIAMISAIARNMEVPEMRKEDFELAVWLVDKSIHYMTSLIGDRLPETDYEGAIIEVQDTVRKAGRSGMTRTDLTRRFRKFKAREMDEIITSLLNQEVVVAERVEGKGRASAIYKYAGL